MKTSNPISQIAYKTEAVLFKVMHAQIVHKNLRYKGKAIPVQPELTQDCQISSQSTYEWWHGCQLLVPAAFRPRNYSWYSFPLETELSLGP
jgi:hypothetical protein